MVLYEEQNLYIYKKGKNMRVKMNFIVAFILVSSLFLMSCNSESDPVAQVDDETLAENKEEVEKEEVEEVEEEFIPEVSQQIDEFPWDDGDDFLIAQEESDADVLIAGFVTVSEGYTDDERENINLAAKSIAGTVLEPGDVFSQNEVAGPYTEEVGYLEGEGYVGGEVVKDFGGGVCNVATTLYNTSIISDVEIVERHNHSMPVDYVPYGQDAAVAYGYKDFQFKNDTEDPMLIWAELVDNRLYMAFYGKESGPEVVWEHETLSVTETYTEYRTNPELDEDEENVLVEGMDGKEIDSFIKIKYDNGEEEVKDLGRSSYNPLINLIEKNE